MTAPPVFVAPPVFIALTGKGAALARDLRRSFPDSEVLGRAGRCQEVDRTFDDAIVELQALFRGGRPIVGLCSAGILIRALAPVLSDKRDEPPVLAVAEDGGAVVPLLGGHRGANRLARMLAGLLETEPSITTAGDRRFGLALDDPPAGWTLANPEAAKAVMAGLLDGATVRMDGDAPWLRDGGLPLAPDGAVSIQVSEKAATPGPNSLLFHPAVLALGVGCERDCDPGELESLARDTLDRHGLAEAAIAGVFSIDLKSDEPAVLALAERLGVACRFFDAATLEAETPRLATPSDRVFREVGCHGVAEAAALAACGAVGRLLVTKTKSARATCAVAVAPRPITVETVGRARGSLTVVGIGPGDPAWRTGEAAAVVRAASDLVGYRLYLDLLEDLTAGKRLHGSGIGAEIDRARQALDLAAEGRDVALICSGDAGIYALATLVFEELERAGRAGWSRVPVRVAPGVSALQAAAARAGAPLGHDFCAISLSDLLTPRAAIERRLRAAADGDFVIAFYNPVSRKRRDLLRRAAEILLARRGPETPVVLARNLGRRDEDVAVIRLRELTVERVDMLTLVLVGSSDSRVMTHDGRDRVYTPRGYAVKARDASGPAPTKHPIV